MSLNKLLKLNLIPSANLVAEIATKGIASTAVQ